MGLLITSAPRTNQTTKSMTWRSRHVSWRARLCAIGMIALPSWSIATVTLYEKDDNPSQHFFDPTNANLGTKVSYLPDNLIQSRNLRRIAWNSTKSPKPDTTIVLLNWVRLKNVILQASVYCSPSLQGVVEQVFVWNNQPNIELTYEKHFANTECPPERLRIFNSPSNLYFQARFMGCVDSLSRYCFLQDDDYLTRPEILLNIHASFRESEQRRGPRPPPIILLPAHDHLETDLLRISVPHTRPDGVPPTHTTFAWLGHGTLLLRSQAEAYLDLLRRMKLNDEEMNMADNYFTLLNAQVPTTWFTHTTELSGVLPFTVGVSGNERNWKHIERAMEYLNEVNNLDSIKSSPHSFTPAGAPSSQQLAAPCIENPCIIYSNIPVLPSSSSAIHEWSPGERLRDIQSRRAANLGEEGAQWYINHPISKAVDGDVETSFRSASTAKSGDYILLMLLDHEIMGAANNRGISMDLVALVDANTASILHASRSEISQNGINWSPLKTSQLTCLPTAIASPMDIQANPPSILRHTIDLEVQKRLARAFNSTTVPAEDLLECYFTFELAVERNSHMHVRMTLDRDLNFGWAIYEVWIRAN